MSQQTFSFDTPAKAEISAPRPYSVSDLNKKVRAALETQFDLIWVQAEISNFKAHTSGHWYFSLKDSKSQVSAVMFRGHNSRLKFRPENGMEVLVRGRITVYEPRGNYQVFCESIEPVGAGALQKQFEQLKAKLKAEGLFDPAKKRALPKLPKKIAVVTSPTGAAIQDILNVLSRRFKGLEVLVVPAIVQGAAAAPKIKTALEQAYRVNNLDAIIVGRGGGSQEDLWCFNDEALARTISNSPVPIISAVGHEIDFTIADFVADLRAPTPSAAAEVVSANAMELKESIETLEHRLVRSVNHRIQELWQKVDGFKRLLVDPKQQLAQISNRLSELRQRLELATRRSLARERELVKSQTYRLKKPNDLITAERQRLDNAKSRMELVMQARLSSSRQRLAEKMSVLDAISPLKVVDRGYSIVESRNLLVKSIKGLKTTDPLRIRVSDGFIESQVNKTIPFKESHFVDSTKGAKA